MRYADRVKELGAADPGAGGNENGQRQGEDGNGHMMESEDGNGVLLAMRNDGVLSPEDSDLAQLRSLNEGELSADWYNFQEAISHLQTLEEELVESHRTTIVGMQQWTKDDLSLLNMTNEVDYDQDAYCQQLEDMIAEKIDTFSILRDKARNFRRCLNDEEAKSRQLMHRNY
jgi:kinesin family protein 2/24